MPKDVADIFKNKEEREGIIMILERIQLIIQRAMLSIDKGEGIASKYYYQTLGGWVSVVNERKEYKGMTPEQQRQQQVEYMQTQEQSNQPLIDLISGERAIKIIDSIDCKALMNELLRMASSVYQKGKTIW